MSWLTSLFPFELPSLALPTFSTPVSIQRRFFGFILRRALGKFLRPGQLESNQIDAQIGSGSIDITELELDDEGVNAQLEGVPLRLRGGSVSRISARIPWSNLWSSPFRVTIQGINLSLVLTEVPPQLRPPALDLAGSVNDVAEVFVRHELSPQDSKVLRQSVVLNRREMKGVLPDEETEDEFRIPGGLESIRTGGRIDAEGEGPLEEKEASLLSSLTERLLSRLHVSILATTLTIIHEDRSQLTLHIPDIQFSTEDSLEHINMASLNERSSPSKSNVPASNSPDIPSMIRTAITRTISIASLSARMQLITRPVSLRQTQKQSPFESSFDSQHHTDGDDTESSSTNSDDELRQMQMSQSIVSLPASASVYHSMASLAPAPPLHSPTLHQSYHSSSSSSGDEDTASPTSLSLPRTIFSTNDRISLQFVSHPTNSYRNQSTSFSSAPSDLRNATQQSTLKPKTIVKLGVGVLALAIDNRHLRSLVDLVSFVIPSNSNSPSPVSTPKNVLKSPATIRDTMEFTLQLRALVGVLILPSSDIRRTVIGERLSSSSSYFGPNTSSQLDDFFAKPLSPFPTSELSVSHARTQFDQIAVTFRKELERNITQPIANSYTLKTVAQCRLADAFLVYYSSLNSTIQPIIIFNPNLVSGPTIPSGDSPRALAASV